MKLKEAKQIIATHEFEQSKGYIVSFEVRERGMLRANYFPEVRANEPGIPSQGEALSLAKLFANAGKAAGVVNVRVCQASDYTIVDDLPCLNPHAPGQTHE